MDYKKLFVALLLLGLSASCAVQGVSTRGLNKYEQAVAKYEAKKYYEAGRLFEEVLPQLRGKKDEASAHFYRAYCSFYEKQYIQSANRFKYFRKTFSLDPRLEEALYMQAHALYLEAPESRLDQSSSQKAIPLFHSYLQNYPEGAYAEQAKDQLEAVTNKLATKAFGSAKLYYQLGYYRAAVVTLSNFQKDFPVSAYHEAAACLKASAQYHYFEKAEENEKKKQLSATVMYCQEFLDTYPDSQNAEAIREIYSKLSTCAHTLVP